MVTKRYSKQQEFKSRQNPCQIRPPENMGNVSASRRCLWVRITVSTVRSASSISESEVQATEKTVWCAARPTKSSKLFKRFFSSRRVTRRQVIRHFTSNGTDQCRNGSSNLLAPYQEQPRLTRIVVDYPRPAFSATRRTNHAPISFDQQAQVSQGHTSCLNKEN